MIMKIYMSSRKLKEGEITIISFIYMSSFIKSRKNESSQLNFLELKKLQMHVSTCKM